MSSGSICGFTQEKWLVDNQDKNICIKVEGGEFLNIATVALVDVLHPGGDGLNPKFYYGPESVANAYLMRAAPDLFKALQGLVQHVARRSVNNGDHLPEIIAARAALDSALMKTPGPKTDGDAAEFEAV